MRRATTPAMLLLYAVAIAAHATNVTLADANSSGTNNFEPALNLQPVAGCSFFETFDQVTPPELPPGWTATNGIDPDGILWQTSDSGDPSPPAYSPPNAAWVNDPDAISDKYLYSPSLEIPPHQSFVGLTFWHNYALEDGFDGGVLEVSIGGGPFEDITAVGGFFTRGGYNGTISTCCGNPLAGRQAWTGNSGGFIETDVDLGFAIPGKPFVLRWRMASDSSGSGEGWRVDEVELTCERPTPSPTPPITPTPTPTPRATPRPRPTPLPRPTPP